MLYFPLLKHLGVQSLKTPSTSPSKMRQEKKFPLHPQDGFLILQTSVSTGSVNLLPPVKVFTTNTLLMLTQLTPLSLTPAQVRRQSVGMMLVLKTKVLIVTSAVKNMS